MCKYRVVYRVISIVLGMIGSMEHVRAMDGNNAPASAGAVINAYGDVNVHDVNVHDVNAIDGDGDTLLHKAIKNGDLNEVRLLYLAGADDSRLTLAHLRALSPEIAKVLCRAGREFKQNTQKFLVLSDEQNPLAQVLMFPEFVSIVKGYVGEPGTMDSHPLRARIAKVLGLEDQISQAAYLFRACRDRDMQKALEGLCVGVDVNGWRNHFGQTFLHVAVGENDSGMATLLIECEANINAKAEDGDRPLHYAVRRNKELVRCLLSQRANINAQGQDGMTSLSLAVLGVGHTYNYDMVRLLLSSGADMSIEDELGRTPLRCAQMFCPRRMELLLQSYRVRQELSKQRCIVS